MEEQVGCIGFRTMVVEMRCKVITIVSTFPQSLSFLSFSLVIPLLIGIFTFYFFLVFFFPSFILFSGLPNTSLSSYPVDTWTRWSLRNPSYSFTSWQRYPIPTPPRTYFSLMCMKYNMTLKYKPLFAQMSKILWLVSFVWKPLEDQI